MKKQIKIPLWPICTIIVIVLIVIVWVRTDSMIKNKHENEMTLQDEVFALQEQLLEKELELQDCHATILQYQQNGYVSGDMLDGFYTIYDACLQAYAYIDTGEGDPDEVLSKLAEAMRITESYQR